MVCHDYETRRRNAAQRDVAMQRNNATGQQKQRDTAQQRNNQPNKQTRQEVETRQRYYERGAGGGDIWMDSHRFACCGYVELLLT
jgi:hypothetical protein